MKFLAYEVQIVERKTEIINPLRLGGDLPIKQERVTLSVSLLSSGCTTDFSNKELASIVLEKLAILTH